MDPEIDKKITTCVCQKCKIDIPLANAIICKFCNNIDDEEDEDEEKDIESKFIEEKDELSIFCMKCSRKCEHCNIRGCKECIDTACCDCGIRLCPNCTGDDSYCNCYGKCKICNTSVNCNEDGWPCYECKIWYCNGCRLDDDNPCGSCNPQDSSDNENDK